MLDAIHWLTSLMQTYAPALIDNPAPQLLVAVFILANVGLFAWTRGREFMILAYSSLLFLVPFVRLF